MALSSSRRLTSDEYLAALLSLPGLATPLVSEDGRWLAWAWYRVGPTADVWLAPTDGSQPPRRLTMTEENTNGASWSHDNRTLLVEYDHDGDERISLFAVDVQAESPSLKLLSDPHPPYFIRGGELHPNMRWLVYGANHDFERGEGIEATWVWRHDVESGERKALARPVEPAAFWPEINELGTHVLYTRNDLDPSGEQLWVADIEGREDREILNFGAEKKVFGSWCPDGRRVLFLAETDEHRKVGLWHLEGGHIRWLIDDPSRNIEEAYMPFRSRHAVIIDMRDASIRPSLLDLESGEERRIEVGAGNLVPLGPLADGTWLGQFSSSRQPADIVRFRPEDARPERFESLTRVWDRTHLTPQDLAPAESFRWTSTDGLECHGWLYRAAAPAKGSIVYVHGGPTSHSEDRINTEIQYFVSRGFNVLDPNYRGSTGYSLAFQESIKDTYWGGLEQDDVRTGIEALMAAGLASPGRVGVTGTSYGGYTSWHAITHWPVEVLAAAAPICGMTDLVVDYETTRPDLRPYSEEMLGGAPDEVPERYRERSPIHFVDRIRGKLLIVQGAQDPNVTPENVRTVRDALERAGIVYDVLTFEDEGHGVSKPANLAVLYRRLADFFEAAFNEGR